MTVPVRLSRFLPRLLVLTLFSIAGLSLGALTPVPASAQTTYVVDSNGDAPDANTGDGTCATAGGNCTLRAAIQEANASTNADNIEFDIPSTGSFATITPSSELVVTEPVTIDGTTSPEYPSTADGPAIVIDGGSLSGSSQDGLQIEASDVTVNALGVNNFPDEGIQVLSGNEGVTIENCFVGVAIDDGETDEGNLTSPDGISDGGVALLGNDFSLTDNVISHNGGDGVYIDASGTGGGNLAVVSGNHIGLDSNGDAAAGNDGAGVRLAGGSDVFLGFFGPNYISANAGSGVVVESGGHDVLNNRIGTDQSGTTEFGNGGSGIEVLANDTQIQSNLISGNDGNGITVGAGNTSADGLTISGNTIGLNRDEDADLPNGTDSATSGGLVCNQSSAVGSGNTTVVQSNTIAGNDGQGVWITENCFDWHVLDNYVGTTSDFSTFLGNGFDGVQVKSNPTSDDEEVQVVENVIGFNANDGVDVRGSYHDVANNYIGVTPDGSDIGNNGRGIVVDGTNQALSDVSIGGNTSLPGNGDAAGATTPTGNGNVIGHNGRFEDEPADNNRNEGIHILGETEDFVVAQNYVGTNPAGDDLGNLGEGIFVEGLAGPHVIGYGPDDGDLSSLSPLNPADGGNANVVAQNEGPGIAVGSGAFVLGTFDVSVRGNVVYQNGDRGTPGIDLGNEGPTPNDNADDDEDDGPNRVQNFPIIENVSHDEATDNVSITYRVQTATGNATYPLWIDFYAADSEASGEGKTYLGTQEYTSGDARSSVTNVIDLGQFPNVSSADHFVATATDDDGNTSEFTGMSSPLPVELASMEATRAGESTVELTWQTASETGNAGFRVQHRTRSDSSWTRVGFVESKAESGTSTEALRYQHTAEDLSVGTHQFRLKQMDLDGSAHLHDPVSIELRMQEAVRLGGPAPNPVRGPATVSFAVKEKTEARLTLYNTLGQRVRTVYRGTPAAGEAQTARLDASGLASGVYFLRLRAGGTTKTTRVTVVR